MVRVRSKKTHFEILLLFSNGRSLGRTVFTILCLLTLIGSSFRPMPGPSFAHGSVAAEISDLERPAEESAGFDRGLYYSVYQVQKGDTVSGISDAFDVTVDSIFSLNNIQSAKSLRPNQFLKIPSMSGIIYRSRSGDTVEAVAEKYGISADRLVEVNNLLDSRLDDGRSLFLPDAKLPSAVVREISGDLFHWPVRGYITSWYSWRRDPFSGRNSFHSGLDIGVPTGTPVRAGMEGRIAETGYSPIMGKYITITHPGGWKTLYAHLSSIGVQEGSYVSRGSRIGLSGNTGYSTGPHVHFSVYKNGKGVNPSNVLQ